MAKLADALDLGSSGQPCRFDSCYPHHKYFTFSDTTSGIFIFDMLIFVDHNFFNNNNEKKSSRGVINVI